DALLVEHRVLECESSLIGQICGQLDFLFSDLVVPAIANDKRSKPSPFVSNRDSERRDKVFSFYHRKFQRINGRLIWKVVDNKRLLRGNYPPRNSPVLFVL